ncbi:MAG: ester cyclase [Janthinobacterium lividum]
MNDTASAIEATARAFLDACDRGLGWEACRPFCTPAASFACQAEPLAGMGQLDAYAEWMKGIVALMPDARYSIEAFAIDPAASTALVHAVFHGTHTGEGGPVPPTGQAMSSDHVYAMRFEGPGIAHVTKIWNSDWALRQLRWT